MTVVELKTPQTAFIIEDNSCERNRIRLSYVFKLRLRNNRSDSQGDLRPFSVVLDIQFERI